jgi:hypothetical protein
MEYVNDLCLTNIIRNLWNLGGLERKQLVGLVHSDLCSINKPSLTSTKYVWTFINEFSGHISWIIRVIYLKSSRNLENLLKINVINLWNFLEQTMEENMWVMIFQGTCHIKVSLGRYLYLTHLRKMVLLEERIKLWWKWHVVCFRTKVYLLSFGKKLSIAQTIC